jgi:hypothetical protein
MSFKISPFSRSFVLGKKRLKNRNGHSEYRHGLFFQGLKMAVHRERITDKLCNLTSLLEKREKLHVKTFFHKMFQKIFLFK